MADLDPYSPSDMSEWLPQRVCLINADVDGGSKAYDAAQANDADVELYDADDLDICQHYGFFSIPPDDTEAVLLDTDAGPATVAERYPPPTTTAVSGLATGSVVTYGLDSGQFIHFHPDGSVYVEPKTGKFIHLGDGATQFVAMANKVLTELQSIRTQHNAHVHATAAVGPPVIPTVLMTAPGAVAATKAKVE